MCPALGSRGTPCEGGITPGPEALGGADQARSISPVTLKRTRRLRGQGGEVSLGTRPGPSGVVSAGQGWLRPLSRSGQERWWAPRFRNHLLGETPVGPEQGGEGAALCPDPGPL